MSVIYVFLACLNVSGSSAYFVWEKYIIDVPAFANVNDYKDDYVLKLYVNGKESKDFYVEYETNCSTFSTVTTNRVGKYTVYYKAYSKSNYISSEQGIIFNVIDVNPPEIILENDVIELEYGQTLDDLVWYRVKDDICNSSEIEVSLNDTGVIYTISGIYKATLIAVDIYGNRCVKNVTIRVSNSINPIIKITKQLNFEYGEEPDLKEYFFCTDAYGNDITKYLTVEGLDIYKLGKQLINVSVTDLSNNTTDMNLEVFVVDNKAPQLDLICSEVTLDILDFSILDIEYFKQFIFRINDNYSNAIELKIDISSLKEEVRDFLVIYKAVDENKNVTEITLKVMLRESTGPVIDGVDYIEIEPGSELDLKSLVEISDPYDKDVSSRLIIESNDLNLDKPGTYYVKYTSFNTSGIYTEKVIEIKVLGEAEQENKENFFDIDGLSLVIIVGVVLVVLVSGGIFFVYKVKKRNNKY